MNYPPTPPIENQSGKHEAANDSLALLYEIGREVTEDLDLHTLLHRVLLLSMKNIGATSGSIIAVDENGQPGESAFLMQGQTKNQTALQLRITYESGMAGWVARNRQAVLISDTSQDERWLRRPEDAQERAGTKSAVSVPILSGEKLVGVITLVHPQAGFFTANHLKLTEAIADWAGAAISRAELFGRLQAANRRYRELFEDSIDPILITDWAGTILESNRQAQCMIGLPPEDLCALQIQGLQTLDERKLAPDFQQLRAGGMLEYESLLHSHLGYDIPVDVHVRSIHYNDESQLQWIIRDITERKDLDRLREDLIAMVYHDLRSPLANIIASLEVLASATEKTDNEDVPVLIRIALRSAARIERLTDSLLDINQLEAGQMIAQRQPADLKELAYEAIETVSLAAQEKRMQISLAEPGWLPPVLVDCDMIRRVFINVLENAIKYTQAEGQIQVQLTGNSEFVQASIRDNGPGIALADQERIFEKFTRLRAKESPRGLGLGLAFCRLAVASHGGQIWVESEIGQGADFKFTLPVARGTR